MYGYIDTAGERVGITCALPWVSKVIEEGAAGELVRAQSPSATLLIRVESRTDAFDTRGWRLLARGVWECEGELVIENPCTAGFDLHVVPHDTRPQFIYRWRPSARDRAAARVLRSRFHLLARAVLTQFPALWWAGVRGRAPLHASACGAGAATPLVCGPSGVGRSTLVLAELAAGGRATSDNLAVSDGETVWGLVEPIRVEGGGGRRMPHDRSEAPMPQRAPSLLPDSVVVLIRGGSSETALTRCEPETAVHSLVTSTYMAGELRRFWAFAATLSAGTGLAPAHPPVETVAARLAASLPCFVLSLAEGPVARLADLVATSEAFEVST
jgi:hypothetical protein